MSTAACAKETRQVGDKDEESDDDDDDDPHHTGRNDRGSVVLCAVVATSMAGQAGDVQQQQRPQPLHLHRRRVQWLRCLHAVIAHARVG